MKKIAKVIIFVCPLIFVCAIPILFVKNIDFVSNCLYKIFGVEKDRAIELFLSILPIIFSLLVVIINLWNDYRKEQKEQKIIEIEKANNKIKYYNSIMLKIIINYNNIMNEMDLVLKKLTFLKTNHILNEIITFWEENTKNIIDLSNDTSFRDIVREKTKNFSILYKNNNYFDHYLKYINNWEPVFSKYNTLSIDDLEFLFNLRNYISFSNKEKDIISIYSDLFNNGNYLIRTYTELEMDIKTMNECFEKEIRTKIINEDRLDELLYCILLKILHFCEILIREIYFTEHFINVMVKKFNEYYERMKKTYKKYLNENIKPQIISHIEVTKNYINEELINNYYKIL